MTLKITVYGKPKCVQCDSVKRHLNSRNSPFETGDVYGDEAAPILELHEIKSAPLVTVSDGSGATLLAFGGYQPESVDKAIAMVREAA